MKHLKIGKRRGEFEVLLSSRSAQVALMTLEPGGASDDQLTNEHPHCEQWLVVLSGRGLAVGHSSAGTVSRLIIREGSLLWIRKGEVHQIRNTGTQPLRTLNFYTPAAYTDRGELRRAAKRRLPRAKRDAG